MNTFRFRFIIYVTLAIILAGCKPSGLDDTPIVEDIPEDKPAYEILSDDLFKNCTIEGGNLDASKIVSCNVE